MSANDPKQTSRILFGVSWLARGLISGFRFFAKALHVSFGLVRCLIVVFADLGDGLVLSRRLYVDDDALPVGCANDPPICESRIGNGGMRPNLRALRAIRRIIALLAAGGW